MRVTILLSPCTAFSVCNEKGAKKVAKTLTIDHQNDLDRSITYINAT